MREEVDQIFSSFAKTKVLLLGDGMIDAYMWGEIHRESPEAPVPVVDVYKREKRLGGAGNVAKNLAALGATTVFCGFVGQDDNGNTFRNLLDKNGMSHEGLFVVQDRPTTVKTRVIASDKHVLRVDEEETKDLSDYTEFKAHIETLFKTHDFDIVIFQDYNKGVLSSEVIEHTIKLAQQKGVPTIVDPKLKNFLAYKGVSLFKPNLKEIKEGLNVEFDASVMENVSTHARMLREALNASRVLLTMSERGVYIQSEKEECKVPAFDRNIVDVSGAGDTVLSVAALALANGLEDEKIALMANLAGGLVCEKVGVVPIDANQLKNETEKHWS